MPKIKTHKGVLKRMRLTKNGKVVFRRAGKRHLMSTKGGDKRRSLGRRRTVRTGLKTRYVRMMQR